MNKYVAEFLGTFVLALAVSLSIGGKFPVPTPVIAGLTLGVCVYTLGAISGTHVNPAITIGLATIGKISPKDAGFYLVAQLAGGGLAIAVSRFLASAPVSVTALDSATVFAAEMVGTFLLATGVAAVVHDKASGPASGLTIGGSLLIGISVAANASNGVLNPAVALAIGSLSMAYVAAPIAGSILAMLLYNKLLARS
jgi:glycerol uptake facilitator-like aquaporin